MAATLSSGRTERQRTSANCIATSCPRCGWRGLVESPKFPILDNHYYVWCCPECWQYLGGRKVVKKPKKLTKEIKPQPKGYRTLLEEEKE